MSDKQKGGLSKSQRKRLRREEKRKASNSPELDSEQEDNLRTTTSASCVSSTANVFNVADGQGTPCKPSVVRALTSQDFGCPDNYYADSQRFVQSVLTHNTPPPAMNVNQNKNIPYGYPLPTPQIPQVPQTPTQYPSTFVTPTQQAAPPAWALQIIEDLKSLRVSNGKIEQSVTNIELKIASIENKVSTLEQKVNDIEQSANLNKQRI